MAERIEYEPNEDTLNDVLRKCGLRSVTRGNGVFRGRNIINKGGRILMAGTNDEVWAWLKATDRVIASKSTQGGLL